MSEPPETPELDRRWHGAFIPDNDWHFHRRLFRRYGVVLIPGEYSRLCKKIRKGKVLPLSQREGRSGSGSGVYAVRIHNYPHWVYVVAAGGKLVTALPPNNKNKRLHAEFLAKSE